jgi:D-alanine-D-alanine ligase
VFVKPANLGSSVGISKVHGPAELAPAVELALAFDEKVLVERGVDAREIECAVLGNEEPEVSVPGEVCPTEDFYSYDAKYLNEHGATFRIPAPLSPELTDRIRAMAAAAFRAIECEGMARVDFFLERGSEKVYVNELNTIPGFTSISQYPKLWQASGLPYPALLDRLIALALERHARRRALRTTSA